MSKMPFTSNLNSSNLKTRVNVKITYDKIIEILSSYL